MKRLLPTAPLRRIIPALLALALACPACQSLNLSAVGPVDPASLPPTIVRWPETRKNFFLTFDAAREPGHLDRILTVLHRRGIRATFFVTGSFIREYSAALRRIVAEGHTVGNHTYWHRKDYADAAGLIAELRETARLYREITGRDLPGIWRAPVLQHIYKPWMLAAARAAGYQHIDVTMATTDWCRRGDPRYLDNDRFVDLFARGIDLARTGQAFVTGLNHASFAGVTADYRGVILVMHTAVYRPDREDFVHTLEAIIDILVRSGYRFDTCGRFAQPRPSHR